MDRLTSWNGIGLGCRRSSWCMPIRIRSRNGVAISYQKGFAAATGDAFVLCEADDQCGEGWLMAMGRALERECICRQRHRLPEAQSARAGVGTTWRANHGRWPAAQFRTLVSILRQRMLLGLRREVVNAIGPPNEAVGAIWDNVFAGRRSSPAFPSRSRPAPSSLSRTSNSLSPISPGACVGLATQD